MSVQDVDLILVGEAMDAAKVASDFAAAALTIARMNNPQRRDITRMRALVEATVARVYEFINIVQRIKVVKRSSEPQASAGESSGQLGVFPAEQPEAEEKF